MRPRKVPLERVRFELVVLYIKCEFPMKMRRKRYELCFSWLIFHLAVYRIIEASSTKQVSGLFIISHNLTKSHFLLSRSPFFYPGKPTPIEMLRMLRIVLIGLAACVFVFQLFPTHFMHEASTRLTTLKDMVLDLPQEVVIGQDCTGGNAWKCISP